MKQFFAPYKEDFGDLILLLKTETNRSGENQFSRLEKFIRAESIYIFLLKRVARSKISLRCYGCRFNLNLMIDAWVVFCRSFECFILGLL